MVITSYIKKQNNQSPLKQAMVLKGNRTMVKSPLSAALLLTSLVDIFAVLVIYLLVNTSATKELPLAKGLKLPSATHSKDLQLALQVYIKNHSYYINEQRVSEKDLKTVLENELAKTTTKELIVQADHNIDFNYINPIMIAGSEAGYTKIKFAVVHREKM